MRIKVRELILLLLFIALIYAIAKADISSHGDDKINRKDLHDQKKCEKVSVPLGHPAALKFHSRSRTVQRWTWLKDGDDFCFCRDGFLDFASGFEKYRSRIKVSCHDIARDATLRFLETDQSDEAEYSVHGDGANPTYCVKLVITAAKTEPTNTAHEAEKPSNKSKAQSPAKKGTNGNKDGKTGLIVGVVVVIVALGLGFLIWWKRRTQNQQQLPQQDNV